MVRRQGTIRDSLYRLSVRRRTNLCTRDSWPLLTSSMEFFRHFRHEASPDGNLFGQGPEDRVFTRENGRPVKHFRRAWWKLTEAAGLPNLLVHDLRRSAARSLRRAGVAESVIMEMWGLGDSRNVQALQHREHQGCGIGRQTQGTATNRGCEGCENWP